MKKPQAQEIHLPNVDSCKYQGRNPRVRDARAGLSSNQLDIISSSHVPQGSNAILAVLINRISAQLKTQWYFLWRNYFQPPTIKTECHVSSTRRCVGLLWRWLGHWNMEERVCPGTAKVQHLIPDLTTDLAGPQSSSLASGFYCSSQ